MTEAFHTNRHRALLQAKCCHMALYRGIMQPYNSTLLENIGGCIMLYVI